jgi:hypothetical protein
VATMRAQGQKDICQTDQPTWKSKEFRNLGLMNSNASKQGRFRARIPSRRIQSSITHLVVCDTLDTHDGSDTDDSGRKCLANLLMS